MKRKEEGGSMNIMVDTFSGRKCDYFTANHIETRRKCCPELATHFWSLTDEKWKRITIVKLCYAHKDLVSGKVYGGDAVIEGMSRCAVYQILDRIQEHEQELNDILAMDKRYVK